ncbi:MAG: AmmeMemoRadiSam system protein A [Clostridia bacterium]|nr:AmmeMemoRadiSam system protein A [Clostridia bacterium]
MGRILSAYLSPHPPIMVHEIGRGREQEINQTIQAMHSLSKDIKLKDPDTIVIITPHGPVFKDAIGISVQRILKGDLRSFGAPQVALSYQNDLELVERIQEEAENCDIPCVSLNKTLAAQYNISPDLDHGAIVPLYFVDKEFSDHKLVHISIGILSHEELYSFGKAIQQAIEKLKRDVVILTSGDLSHRLISGAPAGYHPDGEVFDKKLIKMLKKGDVEAILDMDGQLIKNAGECGLIPIIMMLGVMDGYQFKPEMLSYQGPFGVGYCVATFNVIKKSGERNFLKKMLDKKYEDNEGINGKGKQYVRLARLAVETYVKSGKTTKVPDDVDSELISKKAGVFVTIKKDGQLRGCIGTIQATRKNVAEEIINNAISSATKDYRFQPIQEHELKQLEYSVDVLMEPEAIDSIDQLDVKKYGVIVRSGFRTGLLLPNLEGVDTPQQQVEIALGKAGISKDEDYGLERFRVIRYQE